MAAVVVAAAGAVAVAVGAAAVVVAITVFAITVVIIYCVVGSYLVVVVLLLLPLLQSLSLLLLLLLRLLLLLLLQCCCRCCCYCCCYCYCCCCCCCRCCRFVVLVRSSYVWTSVYCMLQCSAKVQGTALYFSHFRRSPWLTRPIRNFLANFAVTIALVSASLLAAGPKADIRMLPMDADFAPSLKLEGLEKRSWIVNPAGMERPLPAWAIAYAIFPALGFTVLGYLDENLTSLIVNRPSNNLKKPPGYHLDPRLMSGIRVCFFVSVSYIHKIDVVQNRPGVSEQLRISSYEACFLCPPVAFLAYPCQLLRLFPA